MSLKAHDPSRSLFRKIKSFSPQNHVANVFAMLFLMQEKNIHSVDSYIDIDDILYLDGWLNRWMDVQIDAR